MSARKPRQHGDMQLPKCIDACETAPQETWSSQPSRGWHRFVLRGLPPSEWTMHAIRIVGCPCRLEQLLYLPGLSAINESQTMYRAAADWRREAAADLRAMEHVEEMLRSTLAAADAGSIGMDYGLRITHASKPSYRNDDATPLETPIRITMHDLLKLFAERLKEDAARRLGSLGETGLHMSRPGENGLFLRFTAYSPQDRHIGKEDELSRALLTDLATATARARPAGEFRSSFAEWNRRRVATLRQMLPGWGYSELADLIASSWQDWNHAPTALDPKYQYKPQDLSSKDRIVADGARRRRTALIDWLREQEKTRPRSRSQPANRRRKREERARETASRSVVPR